MLILFSCLCFCSIPGEIMMDIFSYLLPQDLILASQVCKTWHRLANDKYVDIWQNSFVYWYIRQSALQVQMYHHWLNYQLIIWIFIFFHFQTIWISQMCICSIYLKISSVIYAAPIFYKWWLIFTVLCGGQYSRSTRVSKAVEGREMSKISLLKAWNKNVWQGETNWKWINNISNDTGTGSMQCTSK